ncbi:MAG: hypothetical protein ACREKN_04455 [Longimicrobiaceae bacterium]
MREPVYEVFARKTRAEPLRHVGALNAPDDELARVFAWNTYDEQNWFEMAVVKRDSLLPVNPRPGATPANGGARRLVRSPGRGSYGGSEVTDPEVAG